MTRPIAKRIAVTLMLAAVPALAVAVEMPSRKAGLWEIRMLPGPASPGAPPPAGITMQHCTDETTDKQMTSTFTPMTKDMCAKNEVQKTATGYTSDSVCTTRGATVTSHSDITGDFNSAYSIKVSSHSQGGPAGTPPDSTVALEAKWLGACKPDQKAGDIVMPGGFKMNVKDMEKMKAMLPK